MLKQCDKLRAYTKIQHDWKETIAKKAQPRDKDTLKALLQRSRLKKRHLKACSYRYGDMVAISTHAFGEHGKGPFCANQGLSPGW